MNTSYVAIPFKYLTNALPYVKGTIYENKINDYLYNIKTNLDFLNSLSRTSKQTVNEVIVPVDFIQSLCNEVRKIKEKGDG